jgi:FkbH-like protein
MVTVIQLPPEPEGYVGALLREGWFDNLTLSDEDRRRGELYSQRDAAEELRATSGSIEDFYRELDMELTIAPVDAASVARAAQLTQKTNQFNVTTRRYSETDVMRRSSDPAWIVRTIRVRDRFGDNGIVGFMMARAEARRLEVDTLLLSCRVIGRSVETAMLAALCREADARGLKAMLGVIVPTPKNTPARDLYERHGFTRIAEDSDGTSRWTRSLLEGRIPWPEWFRETSPGVTEAAGIQE